MEEKYDLKTKFGGILFNDVWHLLWLSFFIKFLNKIRTEQNIV